LVRLIDITPWRTFIYFCALSHNCKNVHKHKIEVKEKMPEEDGTGPSGAGPMTGRGAGYCAVYLIPGHANPAHGYCRGFGRGWGRGFGRGRYAYPPTTIVPPISPQAYALTTQPKLEQEVAALENYHKNLTAEKTDLEQELEGVKNRIKELKAKIGSK
jgi:hypothetical protein